MNPMKEQGFKLRENIFLVDLDNRSLHADMPLGQACQTSCVTPSGIVR
jgi:hypothetical protein